MLIWVVGMVEVTTLASYRHYFTAGELFAWVIANNYEVSDIAHYCLQNNILPYIGYTVLCVGILLLFRYLAKHRKMILGIVLWFIILFPFLYPASPLNLLREVSYVYTQVRNIDLYSENNVHFTYNAHKPSTDSKEVYVYAIGESLRYNNLSLNGVYHRETTPLLANQSNLCLYSNCYANSTLTQHALPLLLTSAEADSFLSHFDQKTIAAAFDETGFRTVLISHRAQLMNNGYHDYLAADFDTTIWVEHDSLIAPKLGEEMAKDDKLFVVTHYLGNHMFYTNRTQDYLIWRPDYNADPKIKSDSLFINAYDNSVRYTDYLLTDAIRYMAQTHRPSAWFFISDHGEYIDHRVSGHGHTYHPTKEEYHVPLIVWYSDEYKEAYPEKVGNVYRHKDKPVCADHVFWSVLDMADIRIDSTVQQEGMSIFGDTLLPHKRTLLLPDGKTVMEL